MRRLFLCCLFALCSANSLFSQSSGASAPAVPLPEPYKAAEFPAWAKDLRRFEIISVGVLPFAVFYSTLAFDFCRYLGGKSIGFSFDALGSGNPFVVSDVLAFDLAYAPWPVKSASSYVASSDEKTLVLISALTLSLAVGIADYFIVKAQDRAERRKKAALRDRIGPAGEGEAGALEEAALPDPPGLSGHEPDSGGADGALPASPEAEAEAGQGSLSP